MKTINNGMRLIVLSLIVLTLTGCQGGSVQRPTPPTPPTPNIPPDASIGTCKQVSRLSASGASIGTTAATDPDAKTRTARGKEPFVLGEVIVKAKATAASVRENPPTLKLRSLGGVSIPLIDTGRLIGGAQVFRLRLENVARAAGASTKTLSDLTLEAVEVMKKRPDIEYALPNYKAYALGMAPNDTCYEKRLQWSLQNQEDESAGINMPKAWTRWSTGGKAVTVAVLDTGIVDSHPDIEPRGTRIKQGFNFVSNSPNGRGPDPTDQGIGTDYHGTHVASVIGAVTSNNQLGMAGINPDVQILPVKVLGDDASGTLTDIVDGLRWVAGLEVDGLPGGNVRVAPRANIVNLSLGALQKCGEVRPIQDTIDEVTRAGVLVVVAAGNESIDSRGEWPAGCENVLVVAASGRDGKLAPYSNFGPKVDVLAPGGNMRAGTKNGILGAINQNGFAFYQGTSMAAPHVAGVAAFIKSKDPTLTPQQLKDTIMRGASRLGANQCTKPCGVGMLNADL